MPEKALQHGGEQVSLHRLGKTEQVAKVHAFRASDKARCISGAVIGLSGGMAV